MLFLTDCRTFNVSLSSFFTSHLRTVLELLWSTAAIASFSSTLKHMLYKILEIRKLIQFVGSGYVLIIMLVSRGIAVVDVFSLLYHEILQQSHTACQSVMQPNDNCWKRTQAVGVQLNHKWAVRHMLLCSSCWFCPVKLFVLINYC